MAPIRCGLLVCTLWLAACAGSTGGTRSPPLAPIPDTQPAQGAQGSGVRSLELRSPPSEASTSATASTPGGRIPDAAVTRDEIDVLLQRGPGWLMSQIALEPVIAAGRRFLGFRLLSIFDDGVRVRRSGVKTGDVIQRVNGLPLRTPDDLTKILASLRQAAAIELKLLRGGEPLTVRLAIVESSLARDTGPTQ